MQNKMQKDITRIAHTMLDKIEMVLAILNPPPTLTGPLTPALAAPWRWTNNQLALWRLCAKPACRRARCCRGEPRLCLDRHLPQVPLDLRTNVRAMLRAARASAALSTTPPPLAPHLEIRTGQGID